MLLPDNNTGGGMGGAATTNPQEQGEVYERVFVLEESVRRRGDMERKGKKNQER
jgi:hypothetical protein